jgi:hypothetical protein
MIVRNFKDSPRITLFGDSNARHLIHKNDAMGHWLIEARPSANSTNTIEEEFLISSDVQAYYCIEGDGVISVSGVDYPVKPNTLLATGSEKPVAISTHSDMRIAAIFCKNGVRNAPVIVRKLEQVNATERDVFWGNGQSKRLLVKRDGLEFAFCVTFGNAGTDSLLQYRNNLESCYYISGSGEYEWESGKHPILTEDGQATVFIMNQYDTHNMRVNKSSICLSIFTPPIEGDESHDFSSGKPSSY